MTEKEYTSFEAEKSLLVFDPASVASIRIEGPEKQAIVLKKEDNHWIIPEYYGFPAGTSDIRNLLDKLGDLKKGWPVASTPGAAKRFKVSPDLFERRIVLYGKDKNVLAELFVGTSPGFRKAHVRSAGDDDVVAAQFSTFEAGLKPEDWLDKDILKLEENEIAEIDLPEFNLIRTGDELKLAELGKDEEEDENQIKTLTRRVAELKIESVLGPENKPEYHQDKPEFIIKVKLKSGKTREYVFSKMDKEDYYVLKESDHQNYFKLITWQAELIRDTHREKLVHKKKKPEEKGSENRGEGQN